ncbi:uncharacterized protein LOC112468606 isoform X1 [Temnothorax curvispinosus]|uniref:Uncharacterized protein LOC112468606 isoform X1 n=1 Tax=Temnothorax curvispinosus TaxID=300111 RepID=A0A6J1RLP0_9HYME|nr:uncharacterized protein LOC112468606 isoform X1 [Temnothorax curvispinosus]
MPNPYCLLCGNRDKSVSYYTFPKNEKSREKWLTFCGIDERVLNTATKLCSNHFQKDDIIHKANKGTFVKPNAVPSIIRKKNVRQHSSLIVGEDCLKKLKSCHDETIDDISFDNVDVKNVNLDDGTVTDKIVYDKIVDDISFDKVDVDNATFDNITVDVDKGNFEFVSVDEDPTISLEETCAIVNRASTLPSCETIQCFQTPVKAARTLRYIGDITISDLDTPKKAERALELAKRIIAKQQRKIKTLQQARNRLTTRITLLKGLIKHLKQKAVVNDC